MKYFATLASALSLLASASAIPMEQRDDVQTVHLTFHGGPAEYSLAIPADGSVHATNNAIAVNIIDAPDYNALYQCQFQTQGDATLVSSISSTGVNQILVGPPAPITSVSCQGMCVATWSDCYRDGQYVGPCCAGYCAANKCRPWVYPF
ncbi:hypothetical protein C8A00DRAFT_43814 [Chaetomidium leptoderma]|uniref:Uncharacterized protein n=1 Tax=Chaetomidium leptoderma TaxID=669021 RepID=A0AAN6VM16_9PEZI|nr:hypothetical protein C8A00DRAFT_43814 [Chaetomidium leptoderma]